MAFKKKKFEENGKVYYNPEQKGESANSVSPFINRQPTRSLVEEVAERTQNILNNQMSIADRIKIDAQSKGKVIDTTKRLGNKQSPMKIITSINENKKQDTNNKLIGLRQEQLTEYAEEKRKKYEQSGIIGKGLNVLGTTAEGILTGTAEGFADPVIGMTNFANNVNKNLGGKTRDINEDKTGISTAQLYNQLKNERAMYGASLNTVNKYAYTLGQQAGYMMPGFIVGGLASTTSNVGEASKIVEKLPKIIQGLEVGGSTYIDNLNEDENNYLKSALKGSLYGIATYNIEGLTGGNFLTKKGGLDKVAEKAISKYVKNETLKKLASKGYEIVGENIEENVENLLDNLIDFTFREKTFKEAIGQTLAEAGETTKQTTLLTAILGVLGLGGGTYNDVKGYETNQRNELIDNSNLGPNSKESLKRVAEKNNWSVENLKNMLEQGGNLNNEQNRVATMENKEISKDNQQVIQEQGKMAQNENMEQIRQNKNNVANIQQIGYNNVESEGDNYAKRFESDVGRRVQNILENYRKGQAIEENSNGIISKEQITTKDDVKRAIMDFANTYRKTNLTEQELKIKNLYETLGGEAVFYEYGNDNIDLGLTDRNKVYIDTNTNENVDNIAYHELAHFLRQNNNTEYIKNIKPIADDIAQNFDKQEIIYNYAQSVGENIEIGMLDGNYQEILAEEVIGDTIASIYGDLEVEYGVDENDMLVIKNTIDNLINKNENSNMSSFSMQGKKKVLNPAEIGNLTKEDANTTPKLRNKNYAKGNKQSSFVSNIINDSKFLNEDLRQMMAEEDNIKYYKGITNKETLEKSYKKLQEGGAQETMNWFNKTDNMSAEDVTKGWILLKQYQDSGDYQGAVEVAKKMRSILTNAGQTVQAANILSRLTPEGMTYYAQSELSEAYNKMIEGKSKKWIDKHKAEFDLSPKETQFIMDNMKEIANMEDGREKKIKLAEIQKLVQDKIPPTVGQSIKAWMRTSMLLNPKTLHRNFLGNAVMVPVNIGSDIVSTGIDKAIAKKTGVRTTGLTNPKQYIKGFGKGLYESFDDFRRGINTRDMEGNKFEIGEGKSFNDKGIGKALNRLDNVLNFALDVGDRPFYEATFTNSINNQLVLNNTTEVTQDMIDIATDEALQRTWQDDNEYTKFVLNLRRGLNKVGIEKYGLGDIIIPFAKTPANLTKAIVDYSPAGLTKTLALDAKKFKNSIENGQYTPQMQHQFVQNLGKGMAGTVLYVIGYALAKAGIATGEADDDKDVKNFLKNSLGISSYSITIGDKSFAYDWAQPVATPLAIMTNYQKYNKNNPDANALEKIWQSMNIGTEQLLEQSFMESLNTVLNGNGTTLENLTKAVFDLPARAIPTFSKQIADMVDGTQRTTFEYDKPFQSAINSAKAKLPGVSKSLPAVRDTLGNEVKKYGGNNNVWNVFFNPANMNKGSLSSAGAEIYRLYQETGETTMFPITAPYYINYKGDKITMTSNERSKFQMTTGQYTEKAVNSLLSNSSYKDLSEDEKVDLISEIVSDSNAKAKYEVLSIESDEASKKRKLIEQISTDNYYDYKLNVMAETNKKRLETKKEDAQLNDIDKIKIINDKKYSSRAKEAIYTTYIQESQKDGKPTEYENLKEYYANNSVLGSKNYRAYDIIDQYLDYKVKASNKLQELKKSGTVSEKSNDLSDKEKTQLLVDSKYTNAKTEAMYVCVVASDTNKDKYEVIKKMNGGNKINTYLDYVLADKDSDKKDDGTKKGETISGSKKKKVVKAIQETKLNQISKIYLLGTEYNLNTKAELNNYYTLKNYISKQSKADQTKILKTLNGKVEMKDGSYKW